MGIVKKYYDAEKVQFMGGGLPPPTIKDELSRLKDKKLLVRQKLANNAFKMSQSYIPKEISYEFEIGPVHQQNPWGTCFAEGATTVIEQWIWRCSGEKVKFSREETWDIAADSKNSSKETREKNQGEAINGGWTYPAIIAAYNFNQNTRNHYWIYKSDVIQKFRDLLDKTHGKNAKVTDIFFHYGSGEPDRGGSCIGVADYHKESLISKLAMYGPMAISMYWDDGRTSGGHVVTLVAADQNFCYVRNSWGSAKLYAIRWSTLVDEWGPGWQDLVGIKDHLKNC